MRFFTKFVFICNLCFVASVVLRLVENAKKKEGNFDGAIIPLQPVESTIVVLGYGAIIINLFFAFACIYAWATGKRKLLSSWMVPVNLVFLLLQIYYFFFSNF